MHAPGEMFVRVAGEQCARLLQAELASRIARGIGISKDTSQWWNLDSTQAAFNKFLVFRGVVEERQLNSDVLNPWHIGIEMFRIQDNIFIFSRWHSEGEVEHGKVRDAFVVFGGLVSSSDQCLKFELRKIADTQFDAPHGKWISMGSSTKTSMEFCGSPTSFISIVFPKIGDAILWSSA